MIGILFAIVSAALFGASVPLSKLLIGSVNPFVFAGILYLGSGIGLLLLLLARAIYLNIQFVSLDLVRSKWLFGAILSGGVAAPVLLATGLKLSQASTASLLLNLESVFTALIAWFVFKENFNKRIAIGMICIVAGGIVLTGNGQLQFERWVGPLAIAGATLCWGLDNNFTKMISDSDPLVIACVKGLVAGVVNCLIAVFLKAPFPQPIPTLATASVGFFGYGLSLLLFIMALSHLGTARTSAYFSTAPFMGSFIAIFFLQEKIGFGFVAAGILMAIGVWFHLTEHHEHTHDHGWMEHDHWHFHDEHHQHEHLPPLKQKLFHSHKHVHQPMHHRHPHYPDVHHRHSHPKE